MKPSDCHSHVYFDQFEEDREKVLERASERLELAGVAGCDPDSNDEVLELAENWDIVTPCLGIHPTFTEAFNSVEEVENQIRKKKPAAIGEIGLDHHHVTEDGNRERQEKVFRRMLELAEELEKPVVVHSRDAEARAVKVLSEYEVETVMLHCFNGSLELAERAAEMGFMIGVTTQVLYMEHVQKLAETIPLENLLLETDAPFLYPDGRNEPVKVEESSRKIADLRNIREREVIRRTSNNAKDTFQKKT